MEILASRNIINSSNKSYILAQLARIFHGGSAMRIRFHGFSLSEPARQTKQAKAQGLSEYQAVAPLKLKIHNFFKYQTIQLRARHRLKKV